MITYQKILGENEADDSPQCILFISIHSANPAISVIVCPVGDSNTENPKQT